MIGRITRAIDRRPLLALTAVVLMAIGVRFVLALDSATPWIFADEFIYSELARSLADRGDLLIRDDRIYFSTLVPLLHAPGYLLGDTSVAYAWIKLANAAAMCAAAYPAYGLARLALSARMSLVFGILVLAWPAYAYTGTVMTEPLFFAVVMSFCWALARALLRPTLMTQGLVAAVLLAAVLTRLQGAVLLVGIPLACGLAALFGAPARSGARGVLARLSRYAPLLIFSLGLPVIALLAQIARSQPVRGLAGGYGGLELGAGPQALLDWSTWHIAVVGLSVGVVPLALAVGAWSRVLSRRWDGSGSGPVLVACLAVSLPLLVQVTLFAINHSQRVQERNLFVIEPLIVVAGLVGICVVGVSRIPAVAAALLLAAALADLPVERLLVPQPPLSDTFTLLSLMETSRVSGIGAASLAIILGIAGVILTGAVLFVRRQTLAIALPAALLLILVGMNVQITPLLADFSDRVAATNVPSPYDWIDRAVPDGETALFVSASEDPPSLTWQAEFWNRSIGPVLSVPTPSPTLSGPVAGIDPRSGRFVPVPGATIPATAYVVAPTRWELAGRRIAGASAQGTAMALWRVVAPLRLRQTTEGLYADGWTGPVMTVRRFDCRPGWFVLALRSGVGRDRRVAITSGESRRVVVLRPGADRRLRIPAVPPTPGGLCAIDVTPLRTATGAQLGNPADPRVLGVRALPPRFEEAG